jgi:peptidoglycan/LPS O-acetylase OafA/YrhL
VIVLLATWLISIPFRPNYMRIVLDQIWYAVLYVYDFFFSTSIFQKSYFLDHFWSLSVEEQFYIFWPLLILLVPEKSLKKLFLSVIVLAPVFRLVLFFIHSTGAFRILNEAPWSAVYPLPFTHMDAFAFGAYISRFSIPKAKGQFIFLAAFLPIAGFVTEYQATGTIGAISALGYPLLLPDAYKFIWAYSFINYFFAVLIYGVAQEKWFTHFLEWRPLRYLGKISYGLYVYHYPLVWFSVRITDLGIEPPYLQPISALLTLVGTILIASLSFRFLEKPIIHLKDRFFPLHAADRAEGSTSLAAEKTTLP